MIATRRWLLLRHVPFEGPGLIATIAAERGLELDVCRLYDGDPLPSVGELAGLVVMGGPMSVRDNTQHPYLLAESQLVASAPAAGLPMLGVCLGAQLIAQALGASVFAAYERAEQRGPRRRGTGGSGSARAPGHALAWRNL
jgi:GMP synthase-like glutamine amidotransferase